ncbi:hypothetical protein TRIUR3_28942 [Triticum urartu]|uniref:Uncharacterized protein n=1 Tax=Triticum urartu TaxID=4572 RepID=M8A0Y1_TRIUA|nr:hypothetical protein TRIUR3_28942 [Triticum urartu]
MALRSLLRKMPALGSRSLPMAPSKLPVHALSPAAGSRLFHHGATGQIMYSGESLARLRENTKLEKARLEKHMMELNKRMEDWHKINKSHDWRQDEDYINFRKKLRRIEVACNVVLLITVPGTAAMLYNLF